MSSKNRKQLTFMERTGDLKIKPEGTCKIIRMVMFLICLRESPEIFPGPEGHM
jgi:hypothetical protein